MKIKVAKFGGTSLADAIQIAKVKKIIMADPARRYIVPSAPGKSAIYDVKVTDLLYGLENAIEKGDDYLPFYRQIYSRFIDIKQQLGLETNIESELEKILRDLLNGEGVDYAASRGEYLNGMLIADYLGYTFIDAAEVILFDKRGKYKKNCQQKY